MGLSHSSCSSFGCCEGTGGVCRSQVSHVEGAGFGAWELVVRSRSVGVCVCAWRCGVGIAGGRYGVFVSTCWRSFEAFNGTRGRLAGLKISSRSWGVVQRHAACSMCGV